jgi:predicted nucleic acid-binding protein
LSGFLLDTNVISKFAPDKPMPSAALQTWMVEQGATDALYLSAMTISEVEKGLRQLHRKGATARSIRLHQWLESIVTMFDDRILSFDTTVARIAGAIEDAAIGKGRHPGQADVIIAATAEAYGLTVVTENMKHFGLLGVKIERPVL